MSALPAMRKGSDLFGETTAFSAIWSRATSWSSGIDGDVRHLALAGLQGGDRRRGLLHADELDVDALALEVAELCGEIHDRVRHELGLEVGGDRAGTARPSPARRGGERRRRPTRPRWRGEAKAASLSSSQAFRATLRGARARGKSDIGMRAPRAAAGGVCASLRRKDRAFGVDFEAATAK